MNDKPNAKSYKPSSDFSRREIKEQKLDESQAQGKSCYLKGEKSNGKKN